MTEEAPALVPLDQPAEPLPEVVADLRSLRAAEASLQRGTGPVAIDTERAHGFRYLPRAYLIQVRRQASGTHLIDPTAFDDAELAGLASVLVEPEWILHAASQDLPSLTERGLRPQQLFDTELGARLLGLPRVALATLLAEAFGVSLRKEHSAADWSRRPLPHDWLVYAALDVELLVELRTWVEARLEEAGKAEWAAQEFAHLVQTAGTPAAARPDPWRRTSGLHAIRTPRGLAVVRELWQERDRLAAQADRAPGRIVPDRALVTLASRVEQPGVRTLGRDDVQSVAEFAWRHAARYQANWLAAIDRAQQLTRAQLPPRTLPHEGPPHPRSWDGRYPEAAARWQFVRETLIALAEQHELPVENLLAPEAQRRLAWEPPRSLTPETLDAFLAGLGAREWQRRLTVPALVGMER